jgi:hypothetical protein
MTLQNAVHGNLWLRIGKGLCVTGDQELADCLKDSEQRYKESRFPPRTPWVKVPTSVVFDTSPWDRMCAACRLAVRLGKQLPVHVQITDEQRKFLAGARGMPLKVLLTMYLWARPYREALSQYGDHEFRGAAGDYRADDLDAEGNARFGSALRFNHQRYAPTTDGLYCDVLVSVPLVRLGSEAITGRGPLDPADELRNFWKKDPRAVRVALKGLRKLGLLELVPDQTPGWVTFAAHGVEPTVRVPYGLWRNGWIECLDGAPLLLLLRLLDRWYEPILPSKWPRTTHSLERHARNSVLVDQSVVAQIVKNLPFSENTQRAALDDLVRLGLVARVRTHRFKFLALLDPELLGKAPQRLDVRVVWHPEAERDLKALPLQERAAILNVTGEIEAEGVIGGLPHSRKVQGAEDLRALRPRRMDCPWRVLYQRIGDALVVGAIAPEENTNRQGFDTARDAAKGRLARVEDD